MEGNSQKTEAGWWLGMVVCDREGVWMCCRCSRGRIRVEEGLTA